MTTVTVVQNNFNGGEFSPSLYAAFDLSKYSNAVKIAKNAIISKTREIMNRQGLEFVAEVYKTSGNIRLLPFKYNSEQSYIVESGDKYFRFIKDGGLVSWTPADIVEYEAIGWTESKDDAVTLDRKNCYGHDEFGGIERITPPQYCPKTICYYEGIYYQDKNHSKQIIFPENVFLSESFSTEERPYTDGEKYYKRKLRVIIDKNDTPFILETPYESESLSLLKYSQVGDVITICSKSFDIAPMELVRMSATEWYLQPISIKSGVASPKDLTGTWTGGTENQRTYTYKVTAVDADGEESVPSNACSVVGEYEASWGVNEKITLNWTAVTGAKEYNIYKNVNGIFGFLGRSETNSFIDDKIEPDISSTPPIQKDLYKESGYPSVVANYQQRCVMANFQNYPQRFVASQVGNPHNFNVSRPVNASDAITIDLAEREINEIRHLVAIDDLIAFTSGAEWAIKGSDGSFSANPTPICTPQSYHGSSDIMPIVSGNMILFVTDTRDCVRDLGYSITSDGYDGEELVAFASHLFENDKIKEWAFRKYENTIWCVMESGALISLLYDKRQEICGWTRHETKGKFLSVAAARENGIDVLYFVVERVINGVTKRFIERMCERRFNSTSDCYFLDCGLRKEFDEKVEIVSGLGHLEGEAVTVLADGGVVENLVVEEGSIELPYPAKKISVGLPYTFRVETLPIETTETVGKYKKITKTDIKIRNSREDFYLQQGSERKLQPRSYESINDADFLKTGTVSANLFSVGQKETEFIIEQPQPLPICISAIAQTVTVNTDV